MRRRAEGGAGRQMKREELGQERHRFNTMMASAVGVGGPGTSEERDPSSGMEGIPLSCLPVLAPYVPGETSNTGETIKVPGDIVRHRCSLPVPLPSNCNGFYPNRSQARARARRASRMQNAASSSQTSDPLY